MHWITYVMLTIYSLHIVCMQTIYFNQVCTFDKERKADCMGEGPGVYLPQKVRDTQIMVFKRLSVNTEVHLPPLYFPDLQRVHIDESPDFHCDQVKTTNKNLIVRIQSQRCKLKNDKDQNSKDDPPTSDHTEATTEPPSQQPSDTTSTNDDTTSNPWFQLRAVIITLTVLVSCLVLGVIIGCVYIIYKRKCYPKKESIYRHEDEHRSMDPPVMHLSEFMNTTFG